MANKAILCDFLASGNFDARDGKAWDSGAIVAFFEPGTATGKAVWTDRDKTTPTGAGVEQITLSADGSVSVYLDGIYDIKIYDASDTGLATPLKTFSDYDSSEVVNILSWDWSSTTSMADPGSGNIRFNNATLASVTALAIADENRNSQDISGYIVTWDDSAASIKGTLEITQTDGAYAVFQITALTDNVGWSQLTVTYIASGGTFTDSARTDVIYSRNGAVTTSVKADDGTEVLDGGTDGTDATYTGGGVLSDIDIRSLIGGTDAAGDLVVRDATRFVRLALGSANQHLMVNAAATGVEWGEDSTIGSLTYDMSTASGTQAYTGVGFKPKTILFICHETGQTGFSVGVYHDGGTDAVVAYSQTAVWTTTASKCIMVEAQSNDALTAIANVTTTGADGFTLNWTKGGAATGTLVGNFIAFR